MNDMTELKCTEPSITKDDVLANMPLLRLLFNESPPTTKEVVLQRNAIWAENRDVAPNLYSNIMELAVMHERHQRAEGMSYGVVADHLGGEVLGGASQPDVALPDGTPVEIKAGDFNAKALRQLQRYMHAEGVLTGVACGVSLSADLPEGVRFLAIKFERSENRYKVRDVEHA